MGLFGEVKCGRCDRRYSAARGRCPYCGARKRRSGKSSGGGDNRWKIVAASILLIIIIVAVAILVLKNISSVKPKATPTPSAKTTATSTPRQSAAPTQTPASTEAPIPAVTPAPSVKVTSIVLTRQDFTLTKIGETWVLGATVLPSNASQIVNWSSEDPKIAKVSSDGRVTAVSAGTTTITAEAGGVKASCMVRVVGSGTVSGSGSGGSESGGASSGLTLNRTDITLDASSKETFTLKVNGTSSTPVFSGGSSSVATIDSEGIIRAVAPGTVSVYATVGGTKLECIVRVVKR